MKVYCKNCKFYKSYYWWDYFRIFWKPISCYPFDEGLRAVESDLDCEDHNKNNDCSYYERRILYFWVKK
ncbi:MAG: hypothetical protein KAT68_17305 [Bacteroidales bacterium]|nr:hypothetical protein [Bacteroidales bacterium]